MWEDKRNVYLIHTRYKSSQTQQFVT